MMCHSRLSAVWVLLAAAAAVELYDELLPEPDKEILYQDTNDIDTGPLPVLHRDDTEATRLKDLLFFRLIKSRLRDGLRTSEHRMQEDTPAGDIPMLGPDLPNVAKRFLSGGARTQQWWKSKKGKVIGSQMVCYFKLCAFRNPA